MPSHAEKKPIEVENYYHIIDPKRRLSEKERAEEVNRVLVNRRNKYAHFNAWKQLYFHK